MKEYFIILFGIFLLSSCSFLSPIGYRQSSVEVEQVRRGYYPYRVMRSVPAGWSQMGVASWYGPDFNGRPTADGSIFNMYAMTAAHKTLPFHTLVKVTNLKNGRHVFVRINDRGPFVRGRIIDLSYGAARRLGILRSGTAPVRLTVVGNKFNTRGQPKNTIRAYSHNVNQKIYAVQAGAFRSWADALTLRDDLNRFLDDVYIIKSIVHNKLFYKVMVGSFFNKYAAVRFAKDVVRSLVSDYYISTVNMVH